MVAVRAVANLRKQFVLSSILGTVAIFGYFGQLSGFGAAFEVMAMLGFGLFFMAVGVIIMTNIMLHIDHVTAELIYGSINVYLLVGLSFAFLHARLISYNQDQSAAWRHYRWVKKALCLTCMTVL